jgi:uncharacterized protein YbjT (DUF2867 family)
MSAPLITVIGATGAQGGALVRAILSDPSRRFRARAVTRNPDGDKARVLADAGAEVVGADADDPTTLDAAFGGADAAFLVTNFWEHFSAEREVTQARSMAEAAKRAGVGHVIWSTLEDTRRWVPLDDDRMPTLHGKYKVPHFDGKGEADEIFRELGVPTTFLLTSFYWENFIHFGSGPQRMPDGSLVLVNPMGDAKLPGIGVEDIGKSAFSILAEGERHVGATVGIAGEHLTGAEMAAAMSEALGQPIGYFAMEADAYRALGFPGADDLGNMFQVKRDFNDDFVRPRSVEESRKLNPEMQDFRTWLQANAGKIPLPS